MFLEEIIFSWECFSPFTEEKLSRDGLDQIIQNICDEKHNSLELKMQLIFSVKGLGCLKCIANACLGMDTGSKIFDKLKPFGTNRHRQIHERYVGELVTPEFCIWGFRL